MNEIIQCVPNFSEGRNQETIEKIVNCFKNTENLKILNYSSDYDHNRMVISLIGTKESLTKSLFQAFKIVKELIDMRNHSGQHPRIGAIDVCPFIPIKNVTIDECDKLANDIAKLISEKLDFGFYLYEYSSTKSNRKNLSVIRQGEYEEMNSKSTHIDWIPDYGKFNIKTGITAIGARIPLIAFNVILDTNNFNIAEKISKNIRNINGGLRYIKAIPIIMKERNVTQVSMNLVDYRKTPLYRVFELIKIEAKRYGVNIIGSELIGLAPIDAIIQTAEYYLQIENLEYNQILEKNLINEF